MIRVWDPSDHGCEYVVDDMPQCKECCQTGWQPRGKQALQPGFIMYSAASGPWQTVWMEEVKHSCLIRSAMASLLDGAAAIAGKDAGLRIEAQLESKPGPCEPGTRLLAAVHLGGQVLAKGEGNGPRAVDLTLPGPIRLWSPSEPVLHSAVLALCPGDGSPCADTVEFTFALRWVSKSDETDHGPKQELDLTLNGERLFQHGVLYQAYWPESIIAPPSPEALEDDVRRIKESGFNLVRVHAAVLPAFFYHLCDREGLLVWQDFPGGDGRAKPLWDRARGELEQKGEIPPFELDEIVRIPESAANFWRELQAVIPWLSSFGCIVCWVPFNEAWGQFDTLRVIRWLRDFGGNRWINTASGWNDISDLFQDSDTGDLADAHNYENLPYEGLQGTFQIWPLPFAGRGLALGEYGGLGYPMEGHEWSPETSWAYGNVSTSTEEFHWKLLGLAQRLAKLLCENRVSAAVYTQWNDIEDEVNGLVTYDRLPKLQYATLLEFADIVKLAYKTCYDSPTSLMA